jgi:hypothetical protein
MRHSFSPLQPAAFAVAGGLGALALALLTGFAMGAGTMMGGGWMMGGYWQYGSSPNHAVAVAGAGVFTALWAFVAGAFASWIVAVVYNAVLRQSSAADTPPPSSPPVANGS